MVNGTAPVVPVRRREIAEADLPALIELLARGFPRRPRGYWARGLARMGRRLDLPPGAPRYGYLLEAEGRPVGALLMLFRADRGRLFCNLSSWTVEPAFRPHAPLLVAAVLGRRDVTFVNLSPAPHTRPTIAAQGFSPLACRTEIVFPFSAGRGRGAVAYPAPGGFADFAEAALLEDHLAYGCLVPVVTTPEGSEPFVLLPLRFGSGRFPLPLAQLVYCRDIAAYRRHAELLGRALLGRGIAGVVVMADGPPSRWDRLVAGRGRLPHVRGPHRPRAGDLAYTERVVLGP